MSSGGVNFEVIATSQLMMAALFSLFQVLFSNAKWIVIAVSHSMAR
jgi:hypothetical protein